MPSYITDTDLSPSTLLYYYLIAFAFIRPIAIANAMAVPNSCLVLDSLC
jgi:hypothetical protein